MDVSIPIPVQQLQVWSSANKYKVEAGVFDVKIGSSQQVFLNSTVTVV